MADTTYNIALNYRMNSGDAESRVWRLSSMFDHLANLAGMVTGFFKGVGESLIVAGQKAEDTRLAFAGMFQAFGAAGTKGPDGFNRALMMSRELLDDLMMRSAKVPGTFEDVQEIFRGLLPGGVESGQSIKAIEEVALKYQGIGRLFRMDSAMVGRELQMLMEGRARASNALFMHLKPLLGISDAKAFNEMSPEKRWEALSKATRGFDDALAAAGNTWTSVSTTTETYFNFFKRNVAVPMLESLKRVLIDVNTWYEKNRVSVDLFAKRLGEGLGQAIKFVWEWAKKLGDVIVWLANHFRTISAVIAYVAATWGVYRLALAAAFVWESRWLILAGVKAVALEALTVAQWGLNIAMAANPIGAIVVAVSALVAALAVAIAYMDELRESFEDMIDVKPMRWLMKKAGIIPAGATDRDIDDAMSSREKEGNRRFRERQESGRNDFLSRLKDNGIGSLFGDMPIPKPAKTAAGGGPSKSNLADYLLGMANTTKQGNMNVNVNMTVQQTINDARDADRVRIDTYKFIKDAVSDAVSFPTQSARNKFSTVHY